MSNQVKLSARPRNEAGRNAVRGVRARGAIPAVIYGGEDVTTNLEVDKRDIENILARAVGENILVQLEINDGQKTTSRLSLIQEVQHHPVRGEIIHVDFHAVSMNEEIDAEVVLEPEGEPVGVKTFGGLLQQSMRLLPIRCLPQNLPEIIVVDVSGLNIGDTLHVRDIKLPPGVTAVPDEELTVFLVSEPTVAEEPVVATEEAVAPEVLKEKKAEEPETTAEPKQIRARLSRVDHATIFRLVVGLGNPGRQFVGTRHNVGFLVAEELARGAAISCRCEAQWDAEVALFGGRLLMKPQTFMNLSGEAVANYARYHRIDQSEILVIVDDAAIRLGELRLRPSGSAGGHNGLESVLIHMGTEAVPRLRIGIGAASGVLTDHVLGKFEPSEIEVVEGTVSRAADAAEFANAHGIEAAMNLYNRKQ